MTAKSSKASIYETITTKLLAAVAADPGNPIMPWQRGGTRPVLPTNVLTGQAYRGVNILSLWITAMDRGYDSGEWATLRQWNEKGACVRKGEKASQSCSTRRSLLPAQPSLTPASAKPSSDAWPAAIGCLPPSRSMAISQLTALPPNPIARIAAAEVFFGRPEPKSSLVARRLVIARRPTASTCRTRRVSSMAMAARGQTPGMRC